MDITVDVVRHIGFLGEEKPWKNELNMVSWNGAQAKYDIRAWDSAHERMSRGITMTAEEAKTLYALLKEEFDKEAK